ncbi:hypothetical protein ES705_28569 [subsurface metagenome]
MMGFGGGAGVKTLLELTDTPSSYAGQALKLFKVNAGETAGVFDLLLSFADWYSGGLPTDFPWGFEAPAPWTYDTMPFFSPVIKNSIDQLEVYVIDRGTAFWRYNIDTKHWTKLPLPNYDGAGCARSLAMSPDGTKLACTSEQYPASDGGRRISVYNLATGIWTDSPQSPQLTDLGNGDTDSFVRSLVWLDDDTIWAWAKTATGAHRFKCLKYTPSTTTWTQYTNYHTSSYATGRPAAIKADGTVVFAGGCGGTLQTYAKYTILTDIYTSAVVAAGRQFVDGVDQDRNRLWYMHSTTGQAGYLNVETEAQVNSVFPANPQQSGVGWLCHGFYGVTASIQRARDSEPSIMTYIGTGMWKLGQQVLTDYNLVLFKKPADGFNITALNKVSGFTIAIPVLVTLVLPAGTWEFFYPKNGDYTKLTISGSELK